ncbi:DUF4430 domain-containing protein [Burkholderia sp. Bp8992]|uniref:DUF4430 domain-containing protein n=2 Tax=unclassified Burkholderia TaxID=2613784 RepID=UPI0011D006F0|nr:DUF4430 domain-containing protein [Burkholderia sp. Bp8992]
MVNHHYGDIVMANSVANQFVDWGSEYHAPPWQANDNIAIAPGVTTVFDLLTADGVSPALNPQSQGSGASLFVTALGGVQANQGGNGYWWVYFVNGKMPDVSCAVYTLQPGDSVAWDYKHYSSGLKQAVHPPLA